MSLTTHMYTAHGGAERQRSEAWPIRLPGPLPLDPEGSVVPALARTLIRRVPQLVEELLALAEEREVRYLDQVPAADLRRSVREHILGFLRFIADIADNTDNSGNPGNSEKSGNTPVHGDPLAVPLAWGHCRAREGVPVESMLRVHRLATQLLWEKLFDEARADSPGTLQRLLDESGPVWEVLDSYSSALVAGYRSAETDARRQDAARRDALFDALLEGRGADPSVAAEARVTLGLPAHGRFLVLALDAGGGDPGRELAAALPGHAVRAVWGLRADREVGLLELGHTELPRLLDRLSATTARRVGVSGEAGGLAELAAAYHGAETALRTLPPGTAGVAAFDDRLLEAFVVTSPQVARRLAQHALGGLLECAQEERGLLLSTLDSWFHCGCSAARAAEELHCHRNTVLNRLRRIEVLTGRSLDDDRHQLACRMALLAVHTLPLDAP
ncbi:PucR family transcriptional regulator [Streptomyces orinoci]|uniref:Helix-turn-helix domain-containing protein n=1 Tax=Streptomyces orinoci TaxID=67339 RepID=A0ABV3K685_STRON|nr:helix-turn-helix domain-containing protein [Streptomyces orinoci]